MAIEEETISATVAPAGTQAAGDVPRAVADSAPASADSADQQALAEKASDGLPAGAVAVRLHEFGAGRTHGGSEPNSIALIQDVELRVKIELGRTQMVVEDVLRLGEGSVVELDKLAGDPVDVFVNDRLVARGEVLVLNDNFCVRISEIVSEVDLRQAG